MKDDNLQGANDFIHELMPTHWIPLSPCPETKEIAMYEPIQLRPCQFCGHEAMRPNKELSPYFSFRGHVRCTNCPAEMNAINQETADAWWNAEHNRFLETKQC